RPAEPPSQETLPPASAGEQSTSFESTLVGPNEMPSISPDTCHSTWILPSVSGALRLTSSFAPCRTLSLFQPTFVVMSPLQCAVAVNVRSVKTIANGSGMTIGAWSLKPPSWAVWLATGTACELLAGAAAAGPARKIAARPVKHAARTAARNFVTYHIGATSFRLGGIQARMDAHDSRQE